MERDPHLTSLEDDRYLNPYRSILQQRAQDSDKLLERLVRGVSDLEEFACAHEYYGLHRRGDQWIFRELAPNASAIWLVGDFSNWERKSEYQAQCLYNNGVWELKVPLDKIRHGQFYHLEILWPGGGDSRIPAYVRRVVQDPDSLVFAAQVWDPPEPYKWQHPEFRVPERFPLIYEAHVGMAQETPSVGTYEEFRLNILPRIAAAGYNTLQLMGIMEHPYYGSFGYQVSSFFACSSRFGTPHDLKALIDDAHGMGLAVIMDLVHSHAVRNEKEGLSLFDGTPSLYFHDGNRGWHSVWDSRCFDYGRTETLHFLLSNCRFWLDEFRFDGFRFDGVTSMLYLHHGIGVDFLDYSQYFDSTVDSAALRYLTLANLLVHKLRPDALTIAEDVSGMPGLGASFQEGGAGFDLRLAMGVPECWQKLVSEVRDEDWSIGYLWYELTNRRSDEQTINYVESHDQALVGGKTMFFQMTGATIYDAMHRGSLSLEIDRAVALHKLIRLATLISAGHGYLNFMGNEFGHPEWIDFPREGNSFSYQYARRLWSLRDDPELRFRELADFDREMLLLLEREQVLYHTVPKAVVIDESAKVLVAARGKIFVLFNFHSHQSHVGYPVYIPPGKYELLLDSDEERFGGQNRIEKGQVYSTCPSTSEAECRHEIRLYLPARTALILKRC